MSESIRSERKEGKSAGEKEGERSRRRKMKARDQSGSRSREAESRGTDRHTHTERQEGREAPVERRLRIARRNLSLTQS